MGKKIARHIIVISATFILTTNFAIEADPFDNEAASAIIPTTDEPQV